MKCDCVFFSFDGLFRALLPGARLDRLRASHPLHGENFIATFTALHHQLLPAVVCKKSSSWQSFWLSLIPTRLKGPSSMSRTTLTPMPSPMSWEAYSGSPSTICCPSRMTSPSPKTWRHRICHEQPQGRMVPSLFPSLRLEYFEKVGVRPCATLHEPSENDSQNDTSEDPIEDASRADLPDGAINVLQGEKARQMLSRTPRFPLFASSWLSIPHAGEQLSITDGAPPSQLQLRLVYFRDVAFLCKALNLHMAVWALMMRTFDGVSAYASLTTATY